MKIIRVGVDLAKNVFQVHGVDRSEKPVWRRKLSRASTAEQVHVPKGIEVRRLHKAFLRYHDPNNWPMLRDALKRMGRADLIGNGKQHLVPRYQPPGTGAAAEGQRVSAKAKPQKFRTQHTGFPKPAKAKARKR